VGEAIKQRGLAHIRATDDGHQRQGFRSGPRGHNRSAIRGQNLSPGRSTGSGLFLL